jgi:hypothetical protein
MVLPDTGLAHPPDAPAASPGSPGAARPGGTDEPPALACGLSSVNARGGLGVPESRDGVR